MYYINLKLGIILYFGSFKNTTVNGREAFYSSNDNVNILVWHDEEFVYKLSGKIEENEMVKIAENIKK